MQRRVSTFLMLLLFVGGVAAAGRLGSTGGAPLQSSVDSVGFGSGTVARELAAQVRQAAIVADRQRVASVAPMIDEPVQACLRPPARAPTRRFESV